ncbi:MAG: hypothetical protein ACPGUE_21595 [Marinomonas sp.]
MICEVSKDERLIRKQLKKVAKIALEDGFNLNKWKLIDDKNIVWLTVKDETGIVAICKIRVLQASMIDIHPYALPNQCNKWKTIVKCLLRWVYSNKKINKVIAFIGINHKTTYILALKIGFNDEGLIKQSYLKDGKLHDQHVVGLTRKEIGDLYEFEQ